MQRITPFLWYDGKAEEAAKFYASIFKKSKIGSIRPGPKGSVMAVEFQLEGQDFIALNGGPHFVSCKTQEEVDELWEKLSAGGEKLEARVAAPLMPLGLFRLRSVATANVVGILWAAAMFAWFFISALYMQLVLGYSALQVGLAFLPANLIMAAFSLGLSARLVMRFGIRLPLAAGLVLAAAGLALFALSPVDGSFVIHVLPGMILLGLGCGMALNPVLLAAMSDVAPSESGLASGIVNTSFMMGGALGLAVLASLAAARTEALLASGALSPVALTGGYHIAFVAGAFFAAAAALLSALLLRAGRQAPAGEDHGLGERALHRQ
jgi:MFS family permease